MKRWMLACLAMLTMLLLVASPAAAKPADNQGSGNSGAAKQCKKGNWVTLARTGDEDTAFVSEEECVSYGAQGGLIVDYVAPPLVVLTPCEEAAKANGYNPGLFARIEVGTGGYDTFTNTAGADLFCASDGGSTILSLDEGDLYIGGGGNDSIDEMNGGYFIGGGGNDSIEVLYGGTFVGHGGNDSVSVQAGGNFNGNDGNDSITFAYGGTYTSIELVNGEIT